MDDAAAQRDGHRLRAVIDTELHQNALDVHLHSIFSNKERHPDLFVALAFGDFLQHIQLSLCEFFRSKMIDQLSGDRRGDMPFARMDGTDSCEELLPHQDRKSTRLNSS